MRNTISRVEKMELLSITGTTTQTQIVIGPELFTWEYWLMLLIIIGIATAIMFFMYLMKWRRYDEKRTE